MSLWGYKSYGIDNLDEPMNDELDVYALLRIEIIWWPKFAADACGSTWLSGKIIYQICHSICLKLNGRTHLGLKIPAERNIVINWKKKMWLLCEI